MKINFLTGPVTISNAVKAAFFQDPISHRSDAFLSLFESTKALLKSKTQAQEVIIMSGSGTLANEAIAQQLKQWKGNGLILSNGIFGDRLITQAQKADLQFSTHKITYGEAFDYENIEKEIANAASISWVWMVLHETSIGMWNDYDSLSTICKNNDIPLALDCISALGVKDINLQDIYLASGVSGKAIGSYPGLSLVFANRAFSPTQNIPQYLDLDFYQSCGGIPFTISSNLVSALHQALKDINIQEKNHKIAEMSNDMRSYFEAKKWTIINDIHPAPNVVTVQLPSAISSVALGNNLEKEGCSIGFKSNYLIERNWIQTFLTSNNHPEELHRFIQKMDQFV